MTARTVSRIDDALLAFPHEGKYEPAAGFMTFLFHGVPYPPASSTGLFKAMQDFVLDPSDVTVVGYPKSGTNWLQVMVSRLYADDWGTLRHTNGIVPHIDMGSRPGFAGYESSVASSAPRLMKAHSIVHQLPRLFREQGVSKVIYVARNGKDVCDSFYTQLDSMREFMQLTLDWPDFVRNFIEGMVPFGSWRDHIIAWREYDEKRGVLHLEFESMRRDVGATLEKIARFIGRPLAPGAIEGVIEETSFANMQKGEMAQRYNGEVVRRSGSIGGWKERFTVAQNELFDQVITRRLEEKGIFLTYDR